MSDFFDTRNIKVESLLADPSDPCIGRGGFGQVWKAFSKTHGIVAVKTEWRRSEADIDNFKKGKLF